MVGEPFLAIVEKGKIKHASELINTYESGDELMIFPKEIYDRLIDDRAEMQIKLDRINEVLDSKELYMQDRDEAGDKKDKLYRIREILQNPANAI